MNVPLLLYAKKIRLPSSSANILQSLNMAAAFAREAKECRTYIGCSVGNEACVRQMLDALGQDVLPDGWRIVRSASKGGYGMRFRAGLLRCIMGRRPVLAYARDISEAFTLALLRRFRRFQFFYEAHEVLHLMHREMGKKEWEQTKRREQNILSAVSGVVATSERVAQELRDSLGYSGPLLVAPNGYNPRIFHPVPLFTAENPWPGPEDTVRLVYVGNFHPGKGVEQLIDTMGLLPRRFQLRIIGGNPVDAFKALNLQAQSIAPGRVTFCGALPQSKIREACLGAHIFVIPQQSEFYFSPLKLYEAFALGIPVLTTPLEVFRPFWEKKVVCLSDGTSSKRLAVSLQNLANMPEYAVSMRNGALFEACDRTWLKRANLVMNFIKNIT